MRRSRKGTKLNDPQYFKTPLPHLRKRMTILRVIPRNIIMSLPIARDSKRLDEIANNIERQHICFDQRSVEVSVEEYVRDCESEYDQLHSHKCDVYVNTDKKYFDELEQPMVVDKPPKNIKPLVLDDRNYFDSRKKSSKDFGKLCVNDPSVEVTTISYTNDRFPTGKVKSKILDTKPRSICELDEDSLSHTQNMKSLVSPVTIRPLSVLHVPILQIPSPNVLQDECNKMGMQIVREHEQFVVGERSKELRMQMYNIDCASVYSMPHKKHTNVLTESKYLLPWKKPEIIVERMDLPFDKPPNIVERTNSKSTDLSLLTLSGCESSSSINCLTQDAQVYTESKYIIPKSMAKITRRHRMKQCTGRSELDSLHSTDTRTSNEENSKRSWWRDRGFKKVVFDFFGQIFSLKKSKPTTRRNSTGNRADGNMSKVKGVYNNDTRIIKEQNIPIRDIHLKADESLRAAYVENVLWSRKLEEENKHYKKVLRSKLQSRKMSSPLY